jgi:hypothetical protein
MGATRSGSAPCFRRSRASSFDPVFNLHSIRRYADTGLWVGERQCKLFCPLLTANPDALAGSINGHPADKRGVGLHGPRGSTPPASRATASARRGLEGAVGFNSRFIYGTGNNVGMSLQVDGLFNHQHSGLSHPQLERRLVLRARVDAAVAHVDLQAACVLARLSGLVAAEKLAKHFNGRRLITRH